MSFVLRVLRASAVLYSFPITTTNNTTTIAPSSKKKMKTPITFAEENKKSSTCKLKNKILLNNKKEEPQALLRGIVVKKETQDLHVQEKKGRKVFFVHEVPLDKSTAISMPLMNPPSLAKSSTVSAKRLRFFGLFL